MLLTVIVQIRKCWVVQRTVPPETIDPFAAFFSRSIRGSKALRFELKSCLSAINVGQFFSK